MGARKYTYLLFILTTFIFVGVGFYFINKNQVHNNVVKATALNYSGSTILKDFNQSDTDKYQTAAGTYDIATMASNVTSTLVDAFSNTTTKPLPLVANWNTGIPEFQNGLDPMYMINKLANGEHVLPSWKLDPYYNDNIIQNYYQASIIKAAELGLPLVFILPSPESALINDDVYFTMNKENNPNVITTNGTILPKLSPLGPNSLWYEVGGQWSTTSLMAQIQEWYPNPPLILFVDEDTSNKLSWNELSSSSRYSSEYPTNKSDEFKKTLVNAKWIEKYRQLHKGFKDGFRETTWKNKVKFVSRDQLAVNMGETSDWANSTTTTNLHANIWPYVADAQTINFNLDGNRTDSSQNAPHVSANNLPFMLEEAKTINPNFNYQLSINANGKIDNPQRYRGYTQFTLWFLRPSVIRQKTAATSQENISPLFQEVIDSVELINYNDILADFWKNGKLVETGTSPLNKNIPTQYNTIPRWFLLDTDSEKTVWAFALVKGEVPNGEWLIYVQSPEANLTDISVTIPEYGNVELNSTQEGSFYSLHENNITISPLNSLNTTKNNTSLMKLGNGITYYFDATNGSDTNDGLSEQTAFKSLNKIQKLNIKPGDNLLLKRGEVFNGKFAGNFSGTKDNYIYIGAYGTGEKPIITSYLPHTLVWTNIGNNIWKAHYNSVIITRLSVNGEEKLKALKIEEIDGKKFIWHPDAKQNLYLYSTVDANSLKIEYTATYSLYINNQSYLNIQDIEVQGAAIELGYSNFINFSNIKSGKYSAGGLQINHSSNISIKNSIFDATFAFDYAIPGYGSDRGPRDGLFIGKSVDTVEIYNNFFKNWGHASIAGNSTDTAGAKNIHIHYNTLTSPDIAYGGRFGFDNNIHNLEFDHNLITNTSVQNQPNCSDSSYHHNYFEKIHDTILKEGGQGDAMSLTTYAGVDINNTTITNNTFIDIDGFALMIEDGSTNGNTISNIVFSNNLITNAGLVSKYASAIGKAIFIRASVNNNNISVIDNFIISKTTSETILYRGVSMSLDAFNSAGKINNDSIYGNNTITDSSKVYGVQRNTVGTSLQYK